MKNLADLKSQVREWSERHDLSDTQLDEFIILVEQDYKQDFYLPPNERIVTLTTDVNGEVGIPTDYLKTKHMRVTTTEGYEKPLYRKPNEAVVIAGNFTGPNLSYFERHGDHFIFAPAAGEGTDVELTYYALIPSMIDTAAVDPNQVNFVFATMPTVYLFGTLMFLHQFTFNEDRAAYYERLFTQAKQDLIGMQEDAEMSGSSLHVVPTMSDCGRWM